MMQFKGHHRAQGADSGSSTPTKVPRPMLRVERRRHQAHRCYFPIATYASSPRRASRTSTSQGQVLAISSPGALPDCSRAYLRRTTSLLDVRFSIMGSDADRFRRSWPEWSTRRPRPSSWRSHLPREAAASMPTAVPNYVRLHVCECKTLTQRREQLVRFSPRRRALRTHSLIARRRSSWRRDEPSRRSARCYIYDEVVRYSHHAGADIPMESSPG